MPMLRLKAPASVVVDYIHFFVNRRAYTLQPNRPHPESGRYYYYHPKDKKTGQGLSLTPDTIRRHLDGEITIGLYSINPATQCSKWVAIDADYKDTLADLLKLSFYLKQDGVPPELRRRFTLGTFFFDLPSDEERETIWGIYLKKYNVSGELPNDEGWTGAEIKECCRKAHRLGITLMQAARYIVPVSRSAAEQIKALRQMASGKFISASTPGVYQYQENPPASRRRLMRDPDGPLTVMPPSKSEA